MKIALAADHGGFEMKQGLIARLREAGHEVRDFGAAKLDPDDDYPDHIIPLARAVAAGEVDRGIVICGSGVGASVAANKVKGIRHGVSHNPFAGRRRMAIASMSLGDGRNPALHRRNLEAKLLRAEPQVEGKVVWASQAAGTGSCSCTRRGSASSRPYRRLRVGGVGLSGKLKRLEYLGVHEVDSA